MTEFGGDVSDAGLDLCAEVFGFLVVANMMERSTDRNPANLESDFVGELIRASVQGELMSRVRRASSCHECAGRD